MSKFRLLSPTTWFAKREDKATAIGANVENRGATFTNSAGSALFGATTTTATAGSALSISTVWACIDILSKHIASLRFSVFLDEKEGGKAEIKGHQSRHLVTKMANKWTTAFDYRRAMVAYAFFFGNSYTWIERDERGRPVALYLARLTSLMTLPDGGIAYKLSIILPTGHIWKNVTALPDDVIHIKAMTFDGLTGLQMLKIMSGTFGAAIAATEFANKYYSSGASLSGVVEVPQVLGDKGAEALQSSIEGFLMEDNSGIMILEAGASYKPIGGDMTQAANAEARSFSVADIGRIFGVPLHMLGDTRQSTYNNVEQFNQGFITNTLLPICEQIESQFDAKLLTVEEYRTDSAYFEHFFGSLLRSDTTASMKRVETLVKWGVIKVNEARIELGYPPDATRDVYLTPVNMAQSDEPKQNEGNA